MKAGSAQAEICCVYVKPEKFMQHMYGINPLLFDCCANPVDHLLLLGKELHGLVLSQCLCHDFNGKIAHPGRGFCHRCRKIICRNGIRNRNDVAQVLTRNTESFFGVPEIRLRIVTRQDIL